MSKYSDRLWQDLVRAHGASLASAARPKRSIPRALRRPGMLAGSVLGLAGASVAILLSVGATPAYAVTTKGNGSVQVTLNQLNALPQANAKLASMGTGEAISIQMASGAATASGPVTCAREASASGPAVEVLVGTNSTEAIPAGNTGTGTWHLASCKVYSSAEAGVAGNTGTGSPPTAGNS